MLFWNKLIEYKEIPEKIPEIWHKSPEIPELSKWLGIAISNPGNTAQGLQSLATTLVKLQFSVNRLVFSVNRLAN